MSRACRAMCRAGRELRGWPPHGKAAPSKGRATAGWHIVMVSCALVAVSAASSTVHGQPADMDAGELQPIALRFFERGSAVAAQGQVTALFDGAAYSQLDDGFPATVLIRLWVYPQGKATPASYAVLQRRVVYDLWDEVYIVRLQEPGRTRTVRVKFKAEALKLLTSLDLDVVALSKVPYDTMFEVGLLAELNPVEQATLAEARKWLAQGNGGGLERGGSLFGSFVSVFVNYKVPQADRVLRLRSQPFYRPRAAKRSTP